MSHRDSTVLGAWATTHNPERRVLAFATAQAADELASAAKAADLSLVLAHSVSALADAREWRPALVIVDAGLGADEAGAIVAAVQATLDARCAMLVDQPSGAALSAADRADVDTVLLRPVDGVMLARAAQAETAGPTNGGSLAVIGESAEMREVLRLTMHAAQSASSVVIQGETGAGKELVARTIHRFSPRRSGPFVAVNCAALPETLLASELFGHERGAFTGAASLRKGRFELADGGTLFLDEIGDLPLGVQVLLLRVLQERIFERLGGSESIAVDVRIIAATHRDLVEEVRAERFRADLFYRLNVLSIHVPALRERKSDLLELWQRFLEEGASAEQRPVPQTSPEAARLLLRYDWPGNVRELHNVAEHARSMTRDELITPASLPVTLTQAEPQSQDGSSPNLGLAGMTLKELEQRAIAESVAAFGTVKAAAAALEISERKIRYRLAEMRTESETAEPPGVNLRVFTVDVDATRAVAELLSREGCEVVLVTSAEAALERLAAAVLVAEPDAPQYAVLTPAGGEGLSGIEVLERIRAQGWSTPTLLVAEGPDAALAEDAGATAVFAPGAVERKEIRDLLRRICEH